MRVLIVCESTTLIQAARIQLTAEAVRMLVKAVRALVKV
jgi:hypothetical protein